MVAEDTQRKICVSIAAFAYPPRTAFLIQKDISSTMKFTITSYGIAKDILGERQTVIETDSKTVGDLRSLLMDRYPKLTDLRSLFIAVNREYAEDVIALKESDEIVLIPPVSGG